MNFRVRVTHDGPRNLAVQIVGKAPFGRASLMNVEALRFAGGRVDSVAIDAVYYVIGDGTQVTVAWDSGEEVLPILPLAGRGRIDFSEVKGLQDLSDGHGCGLSIWAEGEGHFTIVLDFSKHMVIA